MKGPLSTTLSGHFHAALAILALAAGFALPARGQSPVAWELMPYRVRAVVAFDPAAPELTSQARQHLLNGLESAAAGALGAVWELSVAEAEPSLRLTLLRGLESLTLDDVPSALLSEVFDKTLLLVVKSDVAGVRIETREVDIATRQLGVVESRLVFQFELLGDEVFAALRAAFEPLARVDKVDGDTVELSIRAGALPSPDAAPLIAVGKVFQPVVRRTTRKGPQIAAVPWTFLTVKSIKEGRASCRVQTGLRSPVSGRSGRLDSLAIGVEASERPTRLELVSRDKPPKRLSGYEVLSYLPPEKATTLVGRTDISGGLDLALDSPAVHMLLVRHGTVILARLPILPGLSPTLVAELSDDDPRLEAEGFVTGWQEGFVDLLARRQVLATQVRAGISAGKLDEARKLLDELKYLVQPEQLALDLRMRRQKLAPADAQTSAHIDRLFSDTQEAVKRFLDVRDVAELEKEWAAAKAVK